ncbi:MAG: Omp28-related outer membrane protein [Flavobacteriales bacterium]|nr:Omp28-related outer membrane protein [Flavobacteriales bacterium]
MKKFTLILLALSLSIVGKSQYYILDWELGQNPGNLNNDPEYPVGGGLPNTWTTVMTGPVTGWSGDINIPFTFNFNGSDYTTCKVGEGLLTFGTPSSYPGNTNAALPSTSLPDNTIAIWGITVGSGDFIVSKTFGSSPNRQFWVQMNTAGHPNLKSGWAYWSIVLEEGTNNIYIVDQRNQCTNGTTACTDKTAFTVGLQFDGSNAISLAGSPSVQNRAGNDATPVDNVYYAFYPGTQAGEDIMLTDIDMKPDYVLANGSASVKGTFRNIGANAITSFDINYSVNGGADVTQNISGVNIAPGAYYNFTHPTAYTFPQIGKFDIKVWTSMPNGNADANMANDEMNFTFNVHDKVFQRLPLYEIFTSSTCGPCNPGNANFHNVIDSKEDECVYIKFQQSWPGTGDPYCTAESNDRRNYYAINSIPRMEIDGGWDGNAQSFTAQMHNDSKDKPSFVGITATATKMYGKTVAVNIELDPAADFSGTNLLHVAIVEGTTYQNVKSNGETEFTHVMKKMMTGGSGQNIGTLTKGSKVSKTYSYTFNGDYKLPADGSQANWINHTTANSVEEFSDLQVIVWLQNSTTKEVYQAAYADLTSGVIDLTASNSFNIYPNPATNNVNVEFDLTGSSNVEVKVLNTNGQELSTENLGNLSQGSNSATIDVSNLAAGVYYIQLVTDFGMVTKPVTVQ